VKINDMLNRLDTISACATDGRTDKQTDRHRQHSPRYAYASRYKMLTNRITSTGDQNWIWPLRLWF